MDEKQQVTLSPVEAEKFWAGEDARSVAPGPEPGTDSKLGICCVGSDLPGVGFVHSADCPCTSSPVRSGRGSVDGEVPVPQPLRNLAGGVTYDSDLSAENLERRDGLMAQLVFAARALAARNLIDVSPFDARFSLAEPRIRCAECHMEEHAGKLVHTATCRTGRVSGIIADLMKTLDVNPTEKEAAEGETGCVGDGIRPRGLSDRVCLRCGVRGGVWSAEQRPESEVALSLLGLNQCVTASADGKGHTLYTHRCESLSSGARSGAEPEEWIIQRCTQKWIGTELQYEDFPVPEGVMTRSQMLTVLERVGRENPDDEFRGHRVRREGGAQ